MPNVFYVLNPDLRGKLIDYQSMWIAKGILLQANTTQEEVNTVREYLINCIKTNQSIKFVVHDWVDSYATALYAGNGQNEIIGLLKEVQEFSFTLSTGWSDGVTVYET